MTTTSVHQQHIESHHQQGVTEIFRIRKAADIALLKGMEAESQQDPGLSKDEFLLMAQNLLDSHYAHVKG